MDTNITWAAANTNGMIQSPRQMVRAPVLVSTTVWKLLHACSELHANVRALDNAFGPHFCLGS